MDTAKKKRRPTIPFKRLEGELQIEHSKEVLRCRVLLNDIQPDSVGFFVGHLLEIGSRVSLVLEKPKHLFLKGEVTACRQYSLHSNVLSDDAYPYRVNVKFQFASPEQQQEFIAYWNSLR